jgi:LuxR family maltose regulon positive regulatory protein
LTAERTGASLLAGQAQLIERLTERELSLLQFLPTRMTNQEIADTVYLSINTVKSHLRNIYRKLDVADRDGAVARAAELGLL